jgi:hypothetical protein
MFRGKKRIVSPSHITRCTYWSSLGYGTGRVSGYDHGIVLPECIDCVNDIKMFGVTTYYELMDEQRRHTHLEPTSKYDGWYYTWVVEIAAITWGSPLDIQLEYN